MKLIRYIMWIIILLVLGYVCYDSLYNESICTTHIHNGAPYKICGTVPKLDRSSYY